MARPKDDKGTKAAAWIKKKLKEGDSKRLIEWGDGKQVKRTKKPLTHAQAVEEFKKEGWEEIPPGGF